MAYCLTLTSDERDAIDFVGYRYPSGDDLRSILTECMPDEETEWNDDSDITFNIPEHKAWMINDLREQEMDGGHEPYPMFVVSLSGKLNRFCDSIV